MKRIFAIALLFVLTFSLKGFAQENDYSRYPGYVDFGNLKQFENNEESTEVVINEHLLRMVARMGNHMEVNGKRDSALTNMIGGLKLIKVNTFGIKPKQIKSVFALIHKIDKELIAKGWDRLVKQKDKGERTNVLIKVDNSGKIQGLVVAQADSSEATFVNIVGTIDLEKLGDLSSNMNIPGLGNIVNDEKGSNTKVDSTK